MMAGFASGPIFHRSDDTGRAFSSRIDNAFLASFFADEICGGMGCGSPSDDEEIRADC